MITWNELQKYNMTVVSIRMPRAPEIEAKYDQCVTKKKNLQDIKQIVATNGYLLTENNFPYKTESSVAHLVFWFSGNYTLKQAQELCQSILKRDIVIFVNDMTVKSVLDIDHYHVFVQK